MLIFLGRSLRFTILTALFVPAFVLSVLFRRAAGPGLLRWYFQSCGTAFVKLGQVLAMRYDLLPKGYCDELSSLLDGLPPHPMRRIAPIIERELGRPLSECFAHLEPTPLASASVAQVHGATLHTGESVVVKVLRPGVKERFGVDFFYFRAIAWFLDTLGIFSSLELRRFVRELEDLSREEMDFRREARNIYHVHEMMKKDDVDHYAPRVYFGLSGRQVITMERIAGVPVNRLLFALESGDQGSLRAWAELGISPKRTARILLRSLLEQTYRHRVFHVDPHAANLIVMPGGALAWIDFGMIGFVDERIWAQQFKLREAVSSGKIHSAYQNLIATLEPLPPGKDLTHFETDIKSYIRDWFLASKDPGATIGEKSSGYFLLRSFDAMRRAGLSLPSGVMRLYRSMIISDVVMLRLDPEIDWAGLLHDFVVEESQRQLKVLVSEATTFSSLSTALRACVNLPGAALEILDWVQNRLPEMGRSYRDQLSRIEKALLLMVHYTGTVLLLGLFALVGSKLIAPWLLPGGAWAGLGEVSEPYFWPLVLFGGLTALLFWRLMGVFRRS